MPIADDRTAPYRARPTTVAQQDGRRRGASLVVAGLTVLGFLSGPALGADRHGPVEARIGALTGSAALAKPDFQLGEPVKLLVTLKADPTKGVVLPKATDFEMVRVVGANADQNPIPYTPAGEWLNSMSAPDAMGLHNLHPGRSKSFDVDLTEILQLDQPGEKSVAVTLRFTDMDMQGVLAMPKSLTFPILHFTMLSTRAPAAPARAKSFLLVCYESHIAQLEGRPRQLSPLEAELVRENERVMREQLAADALRFRTNPPSNTPGPTANPPPENPDPSQVAEAAIAPKTHDAPAQTPRPFSRIAAVAGLATAVAAAIVAVLLRARSRA